MNQGIALSNANQLIEAKQKLTEAVRIAPDFPDARYTLGVVLMGLGERAEAEKHFAFIVVSRANFPMAWPALGQGINDNQMRMISLHEVGHALGLLGHSMNPADIMFLGESLADIKRDLSERDRQTLLRLYARLTASSGSSSPKTNSRPR